MNSFSALFDPSGDSIRFQGVIGVNGGGKIKERNEEKTTAEFGLLMG